MNAFAKLAENRHAMAVENLIVANCCSMMLLVDQWMVLNNATFRTAVQQ